MPFEGRWAERRAAEAAEGVEYEKNSWDELSPEDQEDIKNMDYRFDMIAKINPNDATARLKAQKDNIDFTDAKVQFLDKLYTLKRTFIFAHKKPTSNVTSTTFAEIQERYNYFKTTADEFNDEDERSQYIEVVERFILQIVAIYETWEKHHERMKEIVELAKNNAVKEQYPQWAQKWFEEGKPWKQFLEGEAPGWPIDWANGPDVVEKHRVPNGGVRIVEDWEKETKDVMTDIDQARGDGVKSFKSGLDYGERTRMLSLDGKTAKTQTTGVALASPFSKTSKTVDPRWDGDLFPINQAISRLDGDPYELHADRTWMATTTQIKTLAPVVEKTSAEAEK